MHSSGLGFEKTGAFFEELISEEVHRSKIMGGLGDVQLMTTNVIR